MKEEKLFQAACAGDTNYLQQYYQAGGEKNVRYEKFGKKHSLIMGAFRNNQFATVRYLVEQGETLTAEEQAEIDTEKQRLKVIDLLSTLS